MTTRVIAQQAGEADMYLGAVEPVNYSPKPCGFRVVEGSNGRIRDYITDALNTPVLVTDIYVYSSIEITCIPPSGWVFSRWVDENHNTLGDNNPLELIGTGCSSGETFYVYAVINQSGGTAIDLGEIMNLMITMMIVVMMMKMMAGAVQSID